jgi:hypothetical protein
MLESREPDDEGSDENKNEKEGYRVGSPQKVSRFVPLNRIHANPRETKSGRGSRVCHAQQPPPQKIVFQKDAKWCILLHFGYQICSVKSLNIVWKNHEQMEISILHIYKSNLGPSNSDGSNLFESTANFPYI